MPSVATQTDISTVSPIGFADWCVANMDTVDGLDLADNTLLSKRKFLKAFPKGSQRPSRHTI